MKKLFYILPLVALAFVSCEDFYLEHQLGYETTIEDVRNFTYTLTDADYSAIANNPTNLKTAGAIGESDSLALIELGTLKYFTEEVAPELYIPAFMAKKYPQLSNGTICEVMYKAEAEETAYAPFFRNIRGYTPPTQLTSVESIASFLEDTIRTGLRKDNFKFVVYYSADSAFVYHWNGEAFVEYVDPSLEIKVMAEADYAAMGLKTMEMTEPDKYFPIYLAQRFPYAQEDDKYGFIYITDNALNKHVLTEYIFDGSVWAQRPNTVEESMSFEMKEVWKANTSVFLNEPFIGHGQGDFVIQDVLLQDPLTYVWYYSATYGMCASAYKSSASYDSESWLVSPRIKLKKARKPALIFDQAFNKAPNFIEEATVLVSTDYKGDVTTATWEALEWNKNEDGTLNVPNGTSWIFQTSGNMDLTKYAGQNIYIAFRYTTSGGVSGTWELQNVLVHETAIEE